MARDLGIADRIRAFGIPVVEVAGWQARGSSSFGPRGSVNHHTAGGPSGALPSLGALVNGFHGSAPGPLCNVAQSREPDGNDRAYVIAAGRANHAGLGGWKGLSGNSTVFGLEIEHTGRTELPIARQQIAARIHAALISGFAHPDPQLTCQHFEWAPRRKIDAATGVDPARFRQLVADALQPAPPPEPPAPPIPKEGEAMLYIGKEEGKPDTFYALNANNELRAITGDQFLALLEQGHQLAGGSVNKGYHPLVILGSTVGALGSKAIG